VFPALGMATAEETDGPRALQMKDAG
jgi:hypothetical protein